MKVSNLWLFFYRPAANAGSAEFSFDADGAGTAAQADQDSRGWFQLKRHAHAKVESLTARVRPRTVLVDAPATVSVSGVRAVARTGIVVVKAGGKSRSGSVRRSTQLEPVLVEASSEHQQAAIKVGRNVGQAITGADAVADVRGARARVSIARVSVEIGPDLELEEILFLLEVA